MTNLFFGSPKCVDILLCVWFANGFGVSQTFISKKTNITFSHVSGCIILLRDSGFVDIVQNVHNRRSNIITCTKKGLEVSKILSSLRSF